MQGNQIGNSRIYDQTEHRLTQHVMAKRVKNIRIFDALSRSSPMVARSASVFCASDSHGVMSCSASS